MKGKFVLNMFVLSIGICVAAISCRADGVVDLDGRKVNALSDTEATVLFFVATSCPISNRYAPEFQRLSETWDRLGVQARLVYAGDESNDEVRAHLLAYGLKIPALRDTRRTLAHRTGVTVTPEAAVFDKDGRVVYHGRIDDRWVNFGVSKPEPSRRDLFEAVNAMLAGKPVQGPGGPAVGCAMGPT